MRRGGPVDAEGCVLPQNRFSIFVLFLQQQDWQIRENLQMWKLQRNGEKIGFVLEAALRIYLQHT